MKWPRYSKLHQFLNTELLKHSENKRQLIGVLDPVSRDVFALQLVASTRRERYYDLIQERGLFSYHADPNDDRFDAERAVGYLTRNSNIDEASWLIFLMTHFAKHGKTGWKRLRDVYGQLGHGIWNWTSVVSDKPAFDQWLRENWKDIGGAFGNHRKYSTIDPNKKGALDVVVDGYIKWIGPNGHTSFFNNDDIQQANDKFDLLFTSMNVPFFGRLAKFDYLMLLGRYDILPLTPQSAYLNDATGPRQGANLLLTGSTENTLTIPELQVGLTALGEDLGVGMEIMEDALCNWQKSQLEFKHFTG